MRRLLVAVFFVLFPCGASAQVSVQEYALPPRVTAHDIWADPAPGGPVWFSGQGSGNGGGPGPKTGPMAPTTHRRGGWPRPGSLSRGGWGLVSVGGENGIARGDAREPAGSK